MTHHPHAHIWNLLVEGVPTGLYLFLSLTGRFWAVMVAERGSYPKGGG